MAIGNLATLPFPRTDWHTHATFYRAMGSRETGRIESMVRRAADLGIAMLGIGEHVNGQPKHPPECYEQLARDLRTAQLPIPTFLGAEVDILGTDGRLSSPQALFERTRPDYVIASVHDLEDYQSVQEYLSKYQQLMLGAVMRDNGADILGHPWHTAHTLVERGLVREWRFELIPETMLSELVDALRMAGKALEVNSRSLAEFADPAYRAFVLRLREAGVKVSVGSDAHTPDALASALSINAFLAEMGFDTQHIWMPARARA